MGIVTTAPEWQGRVGRTWAQEHVRTERIFASIAATLDSAIRDVAPEAGRAIDIGCGIGSTSLALAAARPGLAVTGVDISPDLLAVARDRAAGVANLAFALGDAAAVAGEAAPLDLFVSRHGVMFFPDPVAAFARLNAAARPGAPLVFSCFRARAQNDWSDAVDKVLGIDPPVPAGYAPGPYGFADRAMVADLLARAGWRDARAEAHDLPYVVGTGTDPAADALDFYRRLGSAAATLAAAAPAERAAMEERLAELLRNRVRGDAVTFTAAIWVWRATATGETA